MTKMEKIEFMQDLKCMMEETVDKAIELLKEDIKELRCKVEVIPEMQKDIKELKCKVIPNMQKDIKELKCKIIPDMQEDIRNISRSVAVIEVEHGKKLDILFEALDINSDNIEINKKQIRKCERRIEKNEAEIYCLKTNLSKV